MKGSKNTRSILVLLNKSSLAGLFCTIKSVNKYIDFIVVQLGHWGRSTINGTYITPAKLSMQTLIMAQIYWATPPVAQRRQQFWNTVIGTRIRLAVWRFVPHDEPNIKFLNQQTKNWKLQVTRTLLFYPTVRMYFTVQYTKVSQKELRTSIAIKQCLTWHLSACRWNSKESSKLSSVFQKRESCRRYVHRAN